MCGGEGAPPSVFVSARELDLAEGEEVLPRLGMSVSVSMSVVGALLLIGEKGEKDVAGCCVGTYAGNRDAE